MTNRQALEYLDNKRLAFFTVVIMPYLFLIKNKHITSFDLEKQMEWFEEWLDNSYEPDFMELFPERMK